ncbi:MAG: rod shape-determining protein MreC [Candidatus Bruticola sp.]
MRQFKHWMKVLALLVAVGLVLEVVIGSTGVQTSVMALSPLQKAISALFNQVDDWGRGFFQFASLSRSNDELESEVRSLRAERSHLLAYKVKNLRLQSLLKLKEELPSNIKIAARVIARDPNNWDEKVILDCGRVDGVTEDMVAVSPEGLVGRVAQVGSRSCTLTLIGSSSLAVPVALADSDVYGIMRVSKMKRSIIKYVRFDIPVKPGQLVVTSGLGDVYPGGLAVGRVDRSYVSTEVMYQDILVNLSAELPRLREVILIKKGRLSADPSIFKDAIARAEQEAKAAAQESAEAALRASNQYESAEREDSDSSVLTSPEDENRSEVVKNEKTLPAPLKRSNTAASEQHKNSAAVSNTQPPSAVITEDQTTKQSGSTSTASESAINYDASELTPTYDSDGSGSSDVEKKTEKISELNDESRSAEGHYITVEELNGSTSDEPTAETESEDIEPIPSAVELEP